MLPVKNLPVASPLMPLTWTHSLGSSRRNSLPPDRTASGRRAGAEGRLAQGFGIRNVALTIALPLIA